MLKRSLCASFSLLMTVACGGGGDQSTADDGSQGSSSDTSDTSAGSGDSGTDTSSTSTSSGGQSSTTTDDSTTGGSGASGGSTSADDGSTTDDSSSGGSGGSGGGGAGDPSECRVWMAPDGDDANDGTQDSPVKSLLAAYELMCPKPPDGTENGAECLGEAPRTICAKPGTYQETERLEFRKTRMGTADNRLTLEGDPTSSERPVFDFSGQDRLTCGATPDNIGGFTVNASYVTIKDIVVTGANDTCILVQGTEGLIEHVMVYNCADTGIQISSGGEYEGSGTNNTILNCDSHSNHDVQCDGENADGFAIKKGTGTGNAFIGCRAWDNTDDGFDFFAWTSPVHLENSWAFNQSETTEDDGSDGNGFKLGGDEISAEHELIDLVAVGNTRGTGTGFTANSNPASLSCSGTCAAWGNLVDVDSVSGVDTSPIGNADITNMASDAARNADGSLKSPSEL